MKELQKTNTISLVAVSVGDLIGSLEVEGYLVW